MKPLYPQAQLLQIKPKEKLSNLKNELQDFEEFYGVGRLLQQAQNLIDEQDVQLEEINKGIDEIKNFIELNSPVKEKLCQINYLMQYINFYFKPNEAQAINSELDLFKNHLEQLRNKGLDNESNSNNFFAELDLILVNRIEELFKKIKEIYFERKLSPSFETYFNDQVELLKPVEGEQKTKTHLIFQQLYWLINFLNQFEVSYSKFNELEEKFKNDRNKYLELCKKLINSEVINDRKKTIEEKIEILNKDFHDFNPSVNFPQQLELGLTQLDTTLNELFNFNQAELCTQQEQYAKLIDLLIGSKVNLTLHAKKLKSNFLWAQSGKNKYQAIENIQQKMDALLESGANQEHASSSEEIITDLQQTINEAKAILSEYRGISLLRCFATLWGGGKVTSQLLVETLEEQLSDLQNNITKLPLRL
ncbi:MAG: hypothetical protein E6K54_07140 [Gammaproteobacteria bacterium]|nr:MAG: hypothetical protein E6K54_07140 [Gammaproteobacteria bacterium]